MQRKNTTRFVAKRLKKIVARKLRVQRNLMRKCATSAPIPEIRNANLVCSHQKCGRTWLRFILGHYFNIQYGGLLSSEINLENIFLLLPNYDNHPSRGIPVRLTYKEPIFPQIFFTHDLPDNCLNLREQRGILFLLRYPHDVLVSRFYHCTKHASHQFRGNMSEFIDSEAYGICAYLNYLNCWCETLPQMNHLLLSYEELQNQTEKHVIEIIKFLGQKVELSTMRSAIELSSFETMKQKELEKPVINTNYDPKNAESRRVRQGKVGNFEEHLDEYNIRKIDKYCKNKLTEKSKSIIRTHCLKNERIIANAENWI